jgi:intracellular septation protein
MWHALKELLTVFLSALAYAVLLAYTGNLQLATAVGIGMAVLQMGASLLRRHAPTFMQWASLALVLVLGGTSLLLNDPRFVMIKPSIAHFAIAAVMLRRNWMTQYIPERARLRVGERVIERWGYAWAGLMLLFGCINLALAAHGDIEVWGVTIMALGVAKLVFFAIQYLSLRLLAARLKQSGSDATMRSAARVALPPRS